MALTRKLLKELELNDPAAERIIAAHVETVNALRQERDDAIAQAAQHSDAAAKAQEALTACQTRIETERRNASRRCALTQALTDQGANPQAIPLLLDAITLAEEAWSGDALKDAAAALQPFRAKYGALFTTRTPIPVTRVSPPVHSGGALTHADVKRMSMSDINRSWDAVQKALRTP